MSTTERSSEASKLAVELLTDEPKRQKTALVVILTITPNVAQRWLDRFNTHNRAPKDNRISEYARAMLEHRWRLTTDTIKFGSNGLLLDGQQRLKACVRAQTHFTSAVAFGVDPPAQESVDIGGARTAGDIAHLAGVQNSNETAAVARMLLLHSKFGIDKVPGRQAEFGRKSGKVVVIWSRPDKDEVVRAAKETPGLSDSIRIATQWNGNRLLAPRVTAFCYHLFSAQDQVKAVAFFQEALGAENLKKGSVTHWLHRRLTANRLSKSRLLMTELLALVFKAWIAYRDGKKVHALRWQKRSGEPFPEL